VDTHNNGDLGDVNCSVSSSVLCPPGASIRRQEEHARVRLLDDRAGPAAIYGSVLDRLPRNGEDDVPAAAPEMAYVQRPAAKEESNQTPTSSSKPGQECACESAIQQARAPPSRAIQGKAAEPLEGTLPWVAASFQKTSRPGRPDFADTNDTSTNKAAAFCSEMDATTRVDGFLASSLQAVASIFGFVAYWMCRRSNARTKVKAKLRKGHAHLRLPLDFAVSWLDQWSTSRRQVKSRRLSWTKPLAPSSPAPPREHPRNEARQRPIGRGASAWPKSARHGVGGAENGEAATGDADQAI
ncbi:hypothetical protein THAOC_13862, partial [Thalassiosira oceanica]